jgi:ABC-type transporter Mla MlaB component
MLRITTTQDAGNLPVLKLEGKLLAEWVAELQAACRSARAASGDLQLDLAGLVFVDVAGTIALRELMRQGVSIATTSPLVGELLKEN